MYKLIIKPKVLPIWTKHTVVSVSIIKQAKVHPTNKTLKNHYPAFIMSEI